MFKKKPTVKPLAPLRSSEKRKVADKIIEQYKIQVPSEDGAAAGADGQSTSTTTSLSNIRASLLPEGTVSGRFSTTVGPQLKPLRGTLYAGSFPGEDERILWFRLEQGPGADDRFYPTVYTLWRHPGLTPLLHTPAFVMDKQHNGADLMIPGLAGGPPFPQGATAGAIVAVASTDKPTVPTFVGICEIDVSSLGEVYGQRGHAVRGLQWEGDELWSWGPPGKSGVPAPDHVDGWFDGSQELSSLEVDEVADSDLKHLSLEDKDAQPDETPVKEESGQDERVQIPEPTVQVSTSTMEDSYNLPTLEVIEKTLLIPLGASDYKHIYKEPLLLNGKYVYTDATFRCSLNGRISILKMSTGPLPTHLWEKHALISRFVDTPALLDYGTLNGLSFHVIENLQNCIDIERFDNRREDLSFELLSRIFLEVQKYRRIQPTNMFHQICDTFFVYEFDDVPAGAPETYDLDSFMSFICPEYGSDRYPKINSKMIFSHGDLFYRNVLVTEKEHNFACLIDWDTACLLPDFGEFYSYFYHFQSHGNLFEPTSLRWLAIFYVPSVEEASDVMNYFNERLFDEDYGHPLSDFKRKYISFSDFRDNHPHAYSYLRICHCILRLMTY